jgi:hypothetical protein
MPLSHWIYGCLEFVWAADMAYLVTWWRPHRLGRCATCRRWIKRPHPWHTVEGRRYCDGCIDEVNRQRYERVQRGKPVSVRAAGFYPRPEPDCWGICGCEVCGAPFYGKTYHEAYQECHKHIVAVHVEALWPASVKAEQSIARDEAQGTEVPAWDLRRSVLDSAPAYHSSHPLVKQLGYDPYWDS